MIARFAAASLLILTLSIPSYAEEFRPDDGVAFDVSAEDWVTTKTVHVILNVEAAVSASNATNARAEMNKAVGEVAKGDWRLTNFNRSQDQTGLERWSANFEARIPENDLSGLTDAAKKVSKAGMQIAIGNIDFIPTLEETEAVRANLRAQLYKRAATELSALNAAFPGRNYRIAQINFDSANGLPQPVFTRSVQKNMMMTAMTVPTPAAPDMERSEKIIQTAHVLFATAPTAPATPTTAASAH